MSMWKAAWNVVDTEFEELSRSISDLSSVSDFAVGVDLIGSNLFSLFVDAKPQTLLSTLFSVETEIELCKKTIVRHSKNLDCTEVLRCLDRMETVQLQAIGAEFFYLTSKKFAKNQSIENYSRFLFYMFRGFGFDVHFIKNFFFNDREGCEVKTLLNHIQEWKNVDEEGHNYLLSKTVIMSLEKLANQSKVSDFFEVLESHSCLVRRSPKIDVQKSLQKLLINLVQNIIFKIEGKEWFGVCFDKFISLGFEFNEFLFNKILDMVNKNLSDDSLIDYILAYMRKINVKPNLVTYNTIMDFHCMRGDFDKAQAIFLKLEDEGIKPDNFTFSILIKGIKNLKEPSLETALGFYELYKRTSEGKDIIMYNSLLDVFISMGEIQKAHEIYDELLTHPEHKPDQITYNTLIKGTCKVKDFQNALRYFNDMRKNNLKPNRITYNSIMDLAVKIQDLANCLFFVEEMQKDDISPDGYTYSIILNGLKQNNSPPELVKECLENIRKVIDAGEFKLDEVFFNSILDVCSKYELYDKLKYYYDLMREKGVMESSITFGIIIKAFGKIGEFEKAYEIFDRMVRANLAISDVTYGCILDACSKAGKMDIALKIYESLNKTKLNFNSIVYTTIIKGFAKLERLTEAYNFFLTIKHNKDLTGMIISYNCALDVIVRKGEIEEAIKLFNEIDKIYKADLISYSTIIKGMCGKNMKTEALDCLKKMINSGIEIDISVINLFLDHCSNPNDFRMGIQGFQYATLKNIQPNEITFGIMVKIYGFSRELYKAFDLLDLMAVYKIKPSIIIFTNLIHISFYNKNTKKAELAYSLFKKQGVKGDKLLYSKIIEGLIRFNELPKVEKYIDDCIEDDCGLKPESIDKIREALEESHELNSKLRQIEQINKNERFKKHEPALEKPKFVSKNDNPKQLKKIIHEQNKLDALAEQKLRKEGKKDTLIIRENPQPTRKAFNTNPAPAPAKDQNKDWKNAEKTDEASKTGVKKPLTLFNFREKKASF